VTTSDWKAGLPVLAGSTFTLRELCTEDAPSLLALLTTEEVARFISPPPTTVEGFERFIAWAQRERRAGNYACFAIVPAGMTTAIGIFQIRSLEPGFGTAEWGFAMGSAFWGSGIFLEGAQLVVDFAVDVIGAHRLEARGGGQRPRHGALRKLGAGGRRAAPPFLRHGRYRPGAVGILACDWRCSARCSELVSRQSQLRALRRGSASSGAFLSR
jgi:RimJ/RimL family protein N-acetyltransferase